MTWIDIVAVLPYFVVLAISRDNLRSVGFLRVVRLARIARTFRLSKHRYVQNFRRTKFSAPNRNFGSFVRQNFFIGFLFPHTIHKKNVLT